MRNASSALPVLPSILLGILLSAWLAACDDGGTTRRSKPTETLKPGAAPQATDKPVEKPQYAPPPADKTMYVANIQDAQGRPVARAKVALLREVPTALYMEIPIRSTVIIEFRTPLHGTAALMSEGDNGPRWIWVGGEGFEPFVTPVEAAAPGKRFDHTITVTILPIATLVFKDPQGNLVPEARVTVKTEGDPNEGNTYSADDAGELKVTRRPGTYVLIASDASGRHRYIDRAWNWTGDPAPIVINLPEKSMQ